MKKIAMALLSLVLFANVYCENAKTLTESAITKIEHSDYTVEKVKKILLKHKKITKVENIEVDGSRITIEGLYIRKIRIEKIYTDTDKKISSVVITKKDLEESIIRKNDDVKRIEVTIEDGYLKAEGKAILLGILHSMYLEGSFYITDKRELYYSLKKARVKRIIPVPKGILEKFDKKINPVFHLDDIGIPLYLSRLIFEKDRIIVR